LEIAEFAEIADIRKSGNRDPEVRRSGGSEEPRSGSGVTRDKQRHGELEASGW